MKKILLTTMILVLIPTGVFAGAATSSSVVYSASGQVIPTVTVGQCWTPWDIVFPNNLVGGTQPTQISSAYSPSTGAHPGCVMVNGCYGTAAYVWAYGPNPTVVISSGTNTYTVYAPGANINTISPPNGAGVIFYIDGYIYPTAPLIPGTYTGTLVVEAGCFM